MEPKGKAAEKQPVPQLALVKKKEPEKEELKTRPIDVIPSLSAIHVLGRKGNRARLLGKDEQLTSSGRYLLKTGGLTGQQKTELEEQNVKVHYVKGSEAPYIEISGLTAISLRNMMAPPPMMGLCP